MRLLREVSINGVGFVNAIYDGSGSPVRGVTVDVAEGGGDRLIVRSGFGGNECTALNCFPTASGGECLSFGGPVMGPAVSVEWQGTLSTKVGVIRFWDEPVRAYGSPVLSVFTELAVPAVSDAADWTVDYPGDWITGAGVYWVGTDDIQASVAITKGNVVGTVPLVLGSSGSAGVMSVFTPLALFDSALVRLRNLGAAPADVYGTVVGYTSR